MEIRVLGPVELWHRGRPIRLARRQQRLILGILALRANESVSTSQLIDLLWGDAPPRQARAVVQTRISELRAVLNTADGGLVHLHTRGGEYRLESPPSAVDAQHFLALSQAAREEPDAASAVRTLGRALDLWRGPVLGGDVPDESYATVCQRLESARLTAVEELFDLELDQGNQRGIVDELLATAQANPSRERLVRQLMLALSRVGRSAEALSHYERWRRWLADEFGADPQPETQRVHLSILREGHEDPVEEVAASADGPVGRQPHADVSRLLPPDISDFTGRTVEVERMRRLLTAPTRTGVAVVTVVGSGGVGKSALSVHVAHTVQESFPDGQMYADLHGCDHRDPVDPAEVLGRFLRALGVAGTAVPDTVEERADLYRNLLAERRVLVVLDNAATDEQIIPLVPAGRQCAVIVNGRAHLGSTFGASTLRLAALDPASAGELLARVTGDQRVHAEPAAAAELSRQCGFLPLALRVLGARLAAKPHWSVEKLRGMLRDESRRLDQLSYREWDVRASLAASYVGLSEDARRLLRLTGHLDLAHTDPGIAAASLDVSPGEGEALLEQLFDAHLVEAVRAEPMVGARFRLHHLVRLYARERATAEDDPAELTAARSRGFGAWLTLAELARRAVGDDTSMRHRAVAERYPVGGEPARLARTAPLTWFDSERAALAVVARRAAGKGHPAACWELVDAVSPLFRLRRSLTEWHELLLVALASARSAGDRLGEATILHRLAACSRDRQDFTRAERYVEESQALFATVEDHGLPYLARTGPVPGETPRAATPTPAHRFRLDDLGRIAAGPRAGLLLVEDDPDTGPARR
ncbi:BTAD domain-containing putative transcriptional regulator [Micromonospora sp. WMMD987]|uniref:AfsR/SARP family transcriptional regulator n=1 Tax=Micromonospora sp. WMMD987 TaxID=3016089 RepID=UPI00249A39EE|nr:BTAD domain-containing putative transcriptional regulator [Micromonospora sp. WMMD987]WFE96127.1 BTAD domain-containing putative transcriptional regulator [Micromonospora sp. WMMD987]